MASIDDLDPKQPSITVGDRALDLFTDRYDLTRLFLDRLNEPASDTLLFLYGAGGNGKSLLLRYLSQKCCKVLLSENWAQQKTRTNREISEYVAQLDSASYRPVPFAILDFGLKPMGVEQPQDRFYGLLTLRRALGESQSEYYKLQFPLFDFACVWYLHKKGKSATEIKSLFPVGDVAGVISLIDLVTKNPIGTIAQTFFGFVSQNLAEKATVYLSKRKLSPDAVKQICQWNIETELIENLSGLLAKDLNVAMLLSDAPDRLVLFFDTHEAFWGNQRTLPTHAYFCKDEWLRRLLRGLDYSLGIVAIVAGRDEPRWSEAKTILPGTDIPNKFLDIRQVGNISTSDASSYLHKLNILDPSIHNALIEDATVVPDEVHPFYLGLGADIALQAASQDVLLLTLDLKPTPEGDDKAQILIERLLKYVNQDIRDAIYALCACRVFDYELYIYLGKALNFQCTEASFNTLINFSFIWVTTNGERIWYQVHELLRRLNFEYSQVNTQRSHIALEQFYLNYGDICEAVYHKNAVDSEEGFKL